MTYPCFIIENGSSNTRAGFSTDEIPSLIFSSNYASNTKTGENYIFGNDRIYSISNMDDKFENLEMFSMFKDGCINNWDALEANWKYIFDKFRIDSENNYPLVTTDNIWNSKNNRKKLIQLAFEKFDVPSFCVLKNPLCVTSSMGKANALVVDIGGSILNVTGVTGDSVLNKFHIHNSYAGDYINFEIYDFLKKQYYPEQEIYGKNLLNFQSSNISQSFRNFDLNQSLLDDLKSSINSVSVAPLNENTINNIIFEPRSYILPDNRKITMNQEQLQLCEYLFRPRVTPNNPNPLGIIDVILQVLNKFKDTPDNISELLSNIIITGGTSLLPNLDRRILLELKTLLPNFHINVTSSPNLLERKNNVWYGANVLANLNDFDKFISIEDYEEMGVDAVVEKFK